MCTRRKQNSTFKKFNWVKTRLDPVFLLQIWQKAIPETEMDSLFSQRQKNKQKEGREDTKIADNSSRESFSATLCSKQIIIHFAKKCFFLHWLRKKNVLPKMCFVNMVQ